ncbi:hypothetical protein [Necropsobacter rosorum]|uniref:hypothetical protein n=1 Tax=Necropsobacter rosorum TaxID=908285 RepID=UPI000509BA93
MIKRLFTLALVIAIGLCTVNPASAQQKKGSGIIKKAVIAYAVYKVVKHYKDKKEEQQAKNKPQDHYVEPYYDEECEDDEECEEE